MKLWSVLTIAWIVLFCGCSSQQEVNYIGKTRKEIANMCANYPMYCSPFDKKKQKIMIGARNGYKYYDSVDAILKDPYIMEEKVWDINFVKERKGPLQVETFFYYRVTFENDVVVAQNHRYTSDAL